MDLFYLNLIFKYTIVKEEKSYLEMAEI